MAVIDTLHRTGDKRIELKLIMSEEEYYRLKSNLTNLLVIPSVFDHKVKVGKRLNTYVISIPKTKIKNIGIENKCTILLKDSAEVELYYDNKKKEMFMFAKIDVEEIPELPGKKRKTRRKAADGKK